MSSHKGFTLKELAEATNSEILGDPLCHIDKLSTIDKADKGSITFLTNKRYVDSLSNCNASAIIVSKEYHGYSFETIMAVSYTHLTLPTILLV